MMLVTVLQLLVSQVGNRRVSILLGSFARHTKG